nr:signal peptidase I [uncultured Ruminococcus sp.]
MFRKVINILSTILLILLILLVIFLFIMRITGNSPSIFGYHVFRVSSGSMEPVLVKGDVILVKTVPADEISKNDIITYKSREGQMEGEMITHRVVTEPKVVEGTYYFQTQGDAEGASLDPVVSYEQVEGKYVRKVPLIDKLYSFFLTPYGLITFIFIIILLFGYEMITLILTYRSIDIKDDDYYEPKPKKKSKKRK